MTTTLFDSCTTKRECIETAVHGMTTPDLITKVREKAMKRNDQDLKVLLERFGKLRSFLCEGKTILFDSGRYNDPALYPEFETKYSKLKRWMQEYEALVPILAANHVESESCRCAQCGSLILVAWSSNLQCDACTSSPAQRKMIEQVCRQGWSALRCPSLDGELILVVKDLNFASIPEKHARLVRYTLAELRALGSDQAAIRQVHDIKKTFPKGRVI